MIKTLLAEDEIPLLKGLKYVIESADLGFQVVGCVTNGDDAIQFIKNNNVDVIFTDINMPVVNGIEVMYHIQETKIGCQLVVISGYRDFTYVREALRCGAHDYLVKPINKKELQKVLRQIVVKYRRKQREYFEELLFQNFPYVPQTGKKYYVLCICEGHFISQESDSMKIDRYKVTDILLEQAIFSLVPLGTFPVAIFWNNRNVLFLFIEDSANCDINITQITHKLFSQLLAVTELITILNSETPVPERGLASYCGETVLELKNTILFVNSSIAGNKPSAAAGNKLPAAIPALTADQQMACRYIGQKGDTKTASTFFMNLREAVFKGKTYLQKDVENFFCDIFRLICEPHKLAAIGEITSMIQGIIGSNTSYTEIEKQMEELCLSLLSKPSIYGSKTLLARIDAYIVENFQQPLTTSALAGQFNLVAPYLSRLFKEYKGVTPVQYIQQLRIDNAKKLLLCHPELKIKDIAEITGFIYPLYFSQCFNKLVGMYPSEFRNKYLNMEIKDD